MRNLSNPENQETVLSLLTFCIENLVYTIETEMNHPTETTMNVRTALIELREFLFLEEEESAED